jgi:hypothetical protein
MSLNRSLALVSIAVVLTMSGTANASVKTSVFESSVNAAINYAPRMMNKAIGVATKIREIASSFAREKSLGLPHEIPDIAVKKALALYDKATPHILDDLVRAKTTGSLSEQQVEEIVKKTVTEVMNKIAAKEKISENKFEWLTGRVKLPHPITTPIGGVGEFNLWLLLAPVVTAIYECGQPGVSEYRQCAEAALDMVGKAFRGEG